MGKIKLLPFFIWILWSPFLTAGHPEKEDGFPLRYDQEFETLRGFWDQLASKPDTTAPDQAGFLQLSRQSRAYRGKEVTIEGRLLRVTEIVLPSIENEQINLKQFYESRVLLDDEKKIPICLVTRELPPGIEPVSKNSGETPLRHDRIKASGINYRLASYDGGDDFYTAPVIAALTFSVLKLDTGKTGQSDSAPISRTWKLKGTALAFLLVLWLTVRFLIIPRFRQRKPIQFRIPRGADRPDTDFQFSADELQKMKENCSAPENEPKENGKAGPLVPLLLLALTFCSGTAADEPEEPSRLSEINASFWSEITPIKTDELFQTKSESDPVFQEDLRILLDRLGHGISPALLDRSIPDELANLKSAGINADHFVFSSFPENFGIPVPFRGKVSAITPLSENGSPALFRVTLETSSGQIAVYLPSLPSAWGNDGSKGIGELGAGTGIFFEKYEIPILAASRIGWFSSSSPLGRLGFDLSLFDQVPAFPISALKEELPPDQKQKLLRNFRLTPEDHDPFYLFLSESAALSPEQMKKAAASIPNPVQTVDLFNRPTETQGKPVTLTGHLRRAQKVIIPDLDTQLFCGLDHYYELYLFTADSQEYPILFCTPSLPTAPDGRELPLGTGGNYREEVTLSGFLYKPWAYRIDSGNSSLAPGFLSSEKPEGKSWIAVPLMIGAGGTWTPDSGRTDTGAQFSDGIFWLLAGFAFLVFLYMLARRRSKPIKFQASRRNHS